RPLLRSTDGSARGPHRDRGPRRRLRGGRRGRRHGRHPVPPGEVRGRRRSPPGQLGPHTDRTTTRPPDLGGTAMTPLVETPALTLLPAVDVADGQAVRLVQGEAGTETVYGSPLEAAGSFEQEGAEWIHLVDLDAAFGRGTNYDLLRKVTKSLSIKVELSGGIRDTESLERALDTGAERVNIGTAALEDPE